MSRTHVLLLAVLGLTTLGAASPPWPGESSAPTLDRGYDFTVPGVDNVPDLHGDPGRADLVLFVGGNQFMVMGPLVNAFEAEVPALRGRIFYETLPPGILQRQMAHRNTLTIGGLTLAIQPDVYEAGELKLAALVADGTVAPGFVRYARNELALMVRRGNPKQIHGLIDLGRPGVRISMPNPAWEGVSRQIIASYRKAGGDALVTSIMTTKLAHGDTLLTRIHHRETPMNLMADRADAGVTWLSEAKYQATIGNPIEQVVIPPQQNTTATYAAGLVRGARHEAAARRWLAFLMSPRAQAIYASFGFSPIAPRPQRP